MKQFVKGHKVNYPIVFASQRTLKAFGDIPGIPVKFVLNEKGVIVEKRVGAMEEKAFREMVMKHLDTK